MYIPEPIDENIPSPNITEDASRVFVLTRKNRADIFHLDLLEQNYDCSKPLETCDLSTGHLVIDENNSTILTASFSPDGSAFATASSNGEVHFYKISFTSLESNKPFENSNLDKLESLDSGLENGNNDQVTKAESPLVNTDCSKQAMSPKCLKTWKPHENKSVNSLYFLDDHKNAAPDAQFWSFILTGADFNREIKIWSCLKWICLQTIHFYPSPLDDVLTSPSKSTSSQMPCFKTAIDLTSKYLVMSDITRKCFYVLHLIQESEPYLARCSAISEYILAYPAVSFAIIDSQQIKAKKYNQLNNLTSGNPQEDLTNSLAESNDLINTSISSSASASVPQLTNDQEHLVTMIRVYCIQTKQLQEMQIFLTGEQTISSFNNASNSPPPPLIPLTSSTSTSLLQQLLPNQKTKLTLNTNNSQEINNKFTEDSAIIQIVTPPIGLNAPILMTPDAFINSPNTRKSSEPTQQKMDILQSFLQSSANSSNLLSSRTSSLTQVTTNTTTNEVKQNSSLTKLNGSQKNIPKELEIDLLLLVLVLLLVQAQVLVLLVQIQTKQIRK